MKNRILFLCLLGLNFSGIILPAAKIDNETETAKELVDDEEREERQEEQSLIRSTIKAAQQSFQNLMEDAEAAMNYKKLPDLKTASNPAEAVTAYEQTSNHAIDRFEIDSLRMIDFHLQQFYEEPAIQNFLQDPDLEDEFIDKLIGFLKAEIRKVRLFYLKALKKAQSKILDGIPDGATTSMRQLATNYLKAAIGEPRVKIELEYQKSGWEKWYDYGKDFGGYFWDDFKKGSKEQWSATQEQLLQDSVDYTKEFAQEHITEFASGAADDLLDKLYNMKIDMPDWKSRKKIEDEEKEIEEEYEDDREKEAEELQKKAPLQIVNDSSEPLEIIFIGSGSDNQLTSSFGGSSSTVIYPRGDVTKKLPDFASHNTAVAFVHSRPETGSVDRWYQVALFKNPGKTIYVSAQTTKNSEGDITWSFVPQKRSRFSDLSKSGMKLTNNVGRNDIKLSGLFSSEAGALKYAADHTK